MLVFERRRGLADRWIPCHFRKTQIAPTQGVTATWYGNSSPWLQRILPQPRQVHGCIYWGRPWQDHLAVAPCETLVWLGDFNQRKPLTELQRDQFRPFYFLRKGCQRVPLQIRCDSQRECNLKRCHLQNLHQRTCTYRVRGLWPIGFGQDPHHFWRRLGAGWYNLKFL